MTDNEERAAIIDELLATKKALLEVSQAAQSLVSHVLSRDRVQLKKATELRDILSMHGHEIQWLREP